ncbi:uncharacterized protein LOC110943612 [Helianthus annuus]|uniref:uncharacterized protein LOC110943612 n=1 Tax=Helianthus annuus TaxID=4232 RepID=UPI000B8F5F3A|nr:uncharacterized protein LOC110943612 [Helianthus annuus]
MTLRSGKTAQAIPPAVSEKPVDDEEVDEEIEAESPGEVQQRRVPASTARPKEPVREYVPPIPYPRRLKKQKMEEHYGKFLELFKQLHINLPFVEALAQMPKYAKFLKDILSNKKKLEELSQVTLNEECSAVLQNKLPKKMNDPGSFTIPCLIGSLSVINALADLGASINLMPYAVFAKLDMGEPKPTRMSIQLADRSVKYPREIVENMLVKIDKFVFPVDFVILDMDEDKNVPLILGRPFLATARAMIDVCTGRLTLRVDDEEVTFDIGKSMQHSQSQDDTLYFIETIDTYVSDHLHATFEEDVVDTQLLGGDTFGSPRVDRLVEEVTCLIGHASPPCPEVFEVVDRVTEPKARPSIEDPPSVELKELPDHLEYAFLKGETHLPVIISGKLSKEEKDRLLEVLKQHKKAIAWKIMDIKGINPSFCTHKILMEENFKPVVQHQRCLNPNMQEVVKKEVIKLLDAGLIYPTSDSPWVSPVQVVPKKGGMTVVTNEKNELIPTRTVTEWRVCIDYRKLNDATRKDHFPLPFIDQMLERLSGRMYYCFLDGFYWRFIKDFSKIAFPMTQLLEKDAQFVFSDECLRAFELLKEKLVNAPIMVAPDWELPFELKCDASDFAVGTVLGQRRDKHFHLIYYASKTLNDAQEHYTTTEKELLAVVFAFDKFRSYLVLSKTIVYTDHATLRYLFSKQDAKPRLICWILLLQEFDIEIRDKKGAEKLAADHLSRLEHS